MFLALVRVYSKTGVPSGNLPKSRFSMLPALTLIVAMRIAAPAIAPVRAPRRAPACHEVRRFTTDSAMCFGIANPPGSEGSLTHDMHGTVLYARFGAGFARTPPMRLGNRADGRPSPIVARGTRLRIPPVHRSIRLAPDARSICH